MALETFANDAETILSGAMTAGQLTAPMVNASVFPQSGQYRLKIDNEYLLVTGGHGSNTLTVLRGQEGSVAAAHAAGAEVHHVLTAGVAERFVQEGESIHVVEDFSGNTGVSVATLGDPHAGVIIRPNARIELGSGLSAADILLKRQGAGWLRVENPDSSTQVYIQLMGSGTFETLFSAAEAGDSSSRMMVGIDHLGKGVLRFGPGNAAIDTEMYRAGAGVFSMPGLHMRPQGGTEGGEITLQGSGVNSDWNIDVNGELFRIHSVGAVHLQLGPTVTAFRNPVERFGEAWVTPSLWDGWANFGGGNPSFAYRKDAQGFVHLRGLVHSGAATGLRIANLPAGYRIGGSTLQYFPAVANGAFQYVRVNPNGFIESTDTANTNVWLSLAGIAYKAEA